MKIQALIGMSVLVAACVLTPPLEAQVSISIGIPLPMIVFSAPPQLVVLPDTYVYVVPDREEEIFFFDGWWWTLWDGRWYRSTYYNRGWAHYEHVPSFYQQVPQGWRHDYRNNSWKGHKWNHRKIPHNQVHQNWNRWQKDNYWEKNRGWDVQGYKPGKHSRDVSRYQQSNEQSEQHQVQGQHPQDQKQQHQTKKQKSKSKKSDKKHEKSGDNKEHKK